MTLNPHNFRPEIEGWSSDILPYYHDLALRLPADPVIVEVGVYHGRSLLYLAERLVEVGKDATIRAVDTWGWHDGDFSTFVDHVKASSDLVQASIFISKESSEFMSTEYDDGECDFVFLDAEHDYQNVIRDLTAWWPKVKDGWILAGHDYTHDGDHAGVGRAVDEFFADVRVVRVIPGTNVWEVRK